MKNNTYKNMLSKYNELQSFLLVFGDHTQSVLYEIQVLHDITPYDMDNLKSAVRTTWNILNS